MKIFSQSLHRNLIQLVAQKKLRLADMEAKIYIHLI